MAGEIDLRVSRDGIISAINLTPESVKIDTRLLEVSDFTNLIDNGTFEDDTTNQPPKGWSVSGYDNDNGPETSALCLPAFIDELSNHVVEDRRFVDQTPQVAMSAAVQGTRWRAIVEGTFGTATTNFYYITSVDAIWKTRNTWGGDIKDVVLFDAQNNISARQVKLMQRLGADRGKRFENDHDIEEIQRVILSYPKTALFGRGFCSR